jgi:hypothetical protein
MLKFILWCTNNYPGLRGSVTPYDISSPMIFRVRKIVWEGRWVVGAFELLHDAVAPAPRVVN